MPSLHSQLFADGGVGLLNEVHGERTDQGNEAKATITLPGNDPREVSYIVSESPTVGMVQTSTGDIEELQQAAILVARDQFKAGDLPLPEGTPVQLAGDVGKYALAERPSVYGEILCTIYLSRQPLVAHGNYRRKS